MKTKKQIYKEIKRKRIVGPIIFFILMMAVVGVGVYFSVKYFVSYTLDNKMAQYAINERPNGEVALGYSTKNAGQLTITAERMDEPMILIDNEAGIQFDLSLGGYQFESEAGAFNDRFILISTAPKTSTGIEKAEANGVSVVGADNGIYIQGANSAEISIYSLTGVTLVSKAKEGLNVLPKGTYIVKINKQSMKVLVK